MSTLQIEERITVTAPPARVWKFLLDPARVAACLPGARLDGTEGEDTFLGTMKVKVGPVVMEMKGKATMANVDPVERRVTLTGTGNDKSGGGSARMDMKSQILEKDGGSEIVVMAEVHLAGKLVRFGRGMMEGISKQLFKQFAERVHAALDQDDHDDEEEEEKAATAEPEKAPAEEASAEKALGDNAPAEKAPGEKAPAEEAPAEEAPAEEASAEKASAEKAPTEKAAADKAPAEEAPAEKAAADEAPASETEAKGEPAVAGATRDVLAAAVSKEEERAEPREEATEETASASAEPPKAKAASPVRKKKKPSTKKALAAPADNAPLDAGSLVWAAIWAWIKAFFARIFGKKQ